MTLFDFVAVFGWWFSGIVNLDLLLRHSYLSSFRRRPTEVKHQSHAVFFHVRHFCVGKLTECMTKYGKYLVIYMIVRFFHCAFLNVCFLCTSNRIL